ncbi:SGNH/GDSL hydrolase family protein [Paenibacillus pinihumi]|uniref:SGNH/GDSL hydrolase family protein n=1 Tax=Paenibacillus pinihumi TaxID=669462 RepID=UPI00041068B5|nr:SGNH/GDSL hydrolase family protein [Paenibacillus pinihumi]
MKFASGDKIVLIGDSITDCGRSHPYGDGGFHAFGNGYVSVVAALLQSTYPELNLRIVNMGSSGHNVRDLKARWERDVLDLNPDWLSIMIGINDVWRQFDQPSMTETHVLIEEYEAELEQLIARTKPTVKGLILMTPFYIEPNANDAMRNTMDAYGAVVKKLAEKYDALFVDVQEAFNKVLEHVYPASLGWDRVHPGLHGHAVIARAFLKAVDYDFNKGL